MRILSLLLTSCRLGVVVVAQDGHGRLEDLEPEQAGVEFSLPVAGEVVVLEGVPVDPRQAREGREDVRRRTGTWECRTAAGPRAVAGGRACCGRSSRRRSCCR